MEEYKVVITCSGLGERLGELTKHTNKALVRVGKKPALAYIVESYPKDVEIVVTLGYFGDHIREFLELAYPERKFTFVDVEPYKDSGSSLLYSLLQAKDHLLCPFVFHACDSVIERSNIPTPTENWLGGAIKTNSSHYRTFNVKNNKIISLNEKGELSYDYEYIGLCGIFNWRTFWVIAEQIYNNDKDNQSLSDCHVIMKMLQNFSFNSIVFNNWLDIGNAAFLKKAREKIYDKFQLLDKFDESIFIFDEKKENNFVIKFFADQSVVAKRVARINYLNDLTPKLLGYTKNFYKYDYVPGDLFSESVNINSFNRFLNWADNFLWKQAENENLTDICKHFYFTKTKQRINKFLESTATTDKTQIINGLTIPTVDSMLDSINKDEFCSNNIPGNFHGDFILDNIIENKFSSISWRFFYLLDWRQDFGGRLEFGDIYYDIAKLNHNLIINHEIINNNMYKIEITDVEIKCEILCKSILIDCRQILHDFIVQRNLSLNKVKILTAIIWLNMSPLHYHPFDKFLFYFGKYNLYKALNGL